MNKPVTFPHEFPVLLELATDYVQKRYDFERVKVEIKHQLEILKATEFGDAYDKERAKYVRLKDDRVNTFEAMKASGHTYEKCRGEMLTYYMSIAKNARIQNCDKTWFDVYLQASEAWDKIFCVGVYDLAKCLQLNHLALDIKRAL